MACYDGSYYVFAAQRWVDVPFDLLDPFCLGCFRLRWDVMVMALRNDGRGPYPASPDGYQQDGYSQAYAQSAYGQFHVPQPGYDPQGYGNGYGTQGSNQPYGYEGQPGYGSHAQQPYNPNVAYNQPGYTQPYQPVGYRRDTVPSAYGYGAAPQPPEPPKKKGRGLVVAAVILLVVGLALIVGAGVIWWQSQQAYNENVEEYHQLADANVTEDTSTGRPVVDFAALKALNPQIVGWIQIPQTPVNYPVCQTDNNDYYLNHSFLGRDDEFGAIFMDYRSAADLSGYNTVMYGHHLKNGEMFAEVADYSNQENFDTIRNIYYVSEDGKVHALAALCCIVVSGYDVDAIRFSFADQADFEAYVQSLIDRSSARSPRATSAGVGHIYMLSTCSYATENERTILVCTDLTANNGPVVDATQSMADIQAAADNAAGIAE